MSQSFRLYLPLLNAISQFHLDHLTFRNIPVSLLIRVDHYQNKLNEKFQLDPTYKIYQKKV